MDDALELHRQALEIQIKTRDAVSAALHTAIWAIFSVVEEITDML